MSEPAGVTHRVVDARGTRMHLVEMGEGPLVLLVHGFPEGWYSWRHQLPALAAAGWRAVAIDVRGYGRSSKPLAVEAYRMVCHVGDCVAVVEALGERTAVVVGHDWGSPIAWNSALLRPDMFRGLAMLSVPYAPRSSTRPLEAFRRMAGDEEFYIEYFQEPGRAEAEIEADVREWLLGFYAAASGDPPPSPDGVPMALVRRGGLMKDRFGVVEEMPGWLTEADLEHYVGEFERGGFRGPLNRYRNVDRDWEDLAAFHACPITVPALFIGGERDGPTVWGAAAIERFSHTVPALQGSHVLPGCGHWVQQERPEETNELLLGFLTSLR